MAGILVVAENYIDRAKTGEKLTTEERRHAVNYIIGQMPEVTNVEMAKMFQVDEKSIRNDIKIIKTERAEDVKDSTDVKLIISDLLAARDRALAKIEKGLKAIEASGKVGSTVELNYIKALVQIHLQVTESLQNMGWLPKNIGTLSVNKKVWQAVVEHKTGSVQEVRSIDMFDDLREGESLAEALRRRALEQTTEIQDAEFIDIPQLPLPPPDNDQGNSITTENSEAVEAGSGGPARRAADPTGTALTVAEQPDQCLGPTLLPA